MTWPVLGNELIDWIPIRWAGVKAGLETGELEAKLPFVRVTKLGGTDDGITDFSRFDFDVFALTVDQANTIADDIRDALKPRTRVGSAIIDTVRTDASPHKVPWDNLKIKRVLATYQISARR